MKKALNATLVLLALALLVVLAAACTTTRPPASGLPIPAPAAPARLDTAPVQLRTDTLARPGFFARLFSRNAASSHPNVVSSLPRKCKGCQRRPTN